MDFTCQKHRDKQRNFSNEEVQLTCEGQVKSSAKVKSNVKVKSSVKVKASEVQRSSSPLGTSHPHVHDLVTQRLLQVFDRSAVLGERCGCEDIHPVLVKVALTLRVHTSGYRRPNEV